jgi:endonuclease YncB( thermonuclease family)
MQDSRVGVVDGDTLSMGGERLRIHGIDAPEMSQSCERPAGRYACGDAARAVMSGILGRGVLSCEQLDTDQYQRRVVRCHDEQGRDIGAELVRQGWAMAFTRYSTEYVGQESQARAARRGLWEGRFDAPWDWRARQRP